MPLHATINGDYLQFLPYFSFFYFYCWWPLYVPLFILLFPLKPKLATAVSCPLLSLDLMETLSTTAGLAGTKNFRRFCVVISVLFVTVLIVAVWLIEDKRGSWILNDHINNSNKFKDWQKSWKSIQTGCRLAKTAIKGLSFFDHVLYDPV